ncbi:hypothetical protein EG329_005596 [Mollisiaceae sp. DMI_Dod_QoI]|nr:hypothetical protein EG329_005596 [Helotiales sp. DMI_Dod_QoI]
MALKDRFRRAIRSDRSSSSTSSSNNSNPNSNPVSRAATATPTPHISGSSTPTPTPNPFSHNRSASNNPSITLTKTHTTTFSSSSKLPAPLTRSLTWTNLNLLDRRTKEEKMAEKQQKRLEYWEQKDRDEWSTPEDGWRRAGAKKRCKQHQDLLRAFEWKFREGERGRNSLEGRRSVVSGISPGQSRVGSVDDVGVVEGGRKRSSGVGMTPLSREVSDEGVVGTA